MKTTLTTVTGAALASAISQAMVAPAAMAQPLRFGVNYVPRKNWMYHWLDWDQQSVIEDLQAARDMGFDHIRAHCLWPLFQPGINFINKQAVDNAYSLMDAADRAGLDVVLTVLSGWMSGMSFMPAWTSPNARPNENNNIFSSPHIIEAEKLLFTRLAEAIGKHKRFMGFDLGNELSVLLPLGNSATTPEGDAWTIGMFKHLNAIAPGKFHVNGLDHRVWFSDIAFSRPVMGNYGAASVVHSYPFFDGALERYSYNGIGTLHLLEYNLELAYAYHDRIDRRVWAQEIGANAEWMPESYMAEYMRRVVEYGAETGKAWGLSWWGSHELDRSLKGFQTLEYTMGLIDQNNHVKPFGRSVSELVKSFSGKTYPANQRPAALVIPVKGLAPHIEETDNDWTYATAFMNLIKRGKKPCIVLESRVKDEDYLRSRGIKELISLADASKA